MISFLGFIVQKPSHCQQSLLGKWQSWYLSSPFEGSPIASRASKLTGFKRPHGPELTRPVRDDDDIQGVACRVCADLYTPTIETWRLDSWIVVVQASALLFPDVVVPTSSRPGSSSQVSQQKPRSTCQISLFVRHFYLIFYGSPKLIPFCTHFVQGGYLLFFPYYRIHVSTK